MFFADEKIFVPGSFCSHCDRSLTFCRLNSFTAFFLLKNPDSRCVYMQVRTLESCVSSFTNNAPGFLSSSKIGLGQKPKTQDCGFVCDLR